MKLFLNSLALSAAFLLSAHGYAQNTMATPAKPSASAAMSASAKMASKPASAPMAAAPGGGDGKVWVNTASKTYHCAGTKYYGKTKAGEYMPEADAKAKGNHPNNKKACS